MKKQLLFVWIMVSHLISCGTSHMEAKDFNVASYGAQPNDQIDDTKAIQACLNAVAKHGGKMQLSAGDYRISAALNLKYTNNTGTVEIDGRGARLVLTKRVKRGLRVEGNTDFSSLRIKNLKMDGQINRSQRDALFDGTFFQTGINVYMISDVVLENIRVSNLYGNGITLIQKQYTTSAQDQAKENFEIKNCQVLNVQGFNPNKEAGGRAYDDYGDGIYIRSGKSGIVSGCKVVNQTATTGKVGRAGIAITRDNKNVQFLKDTVIGYDRGIHIENTYGGHEISNCFISDNNCGILVGSSKCPYLKSNPIKVTKNEVHGSSRDRNIYGGIATSSLIVFYKSDELINGSEVSSNTLIDSPKTQRKDMIAIQQAELKFNKNLVKGSGASSKATIRLPVTQCYGNTFENINYLYITGVGDQKNTFRDIVHNRVK